MVDFLIELGQSPLSLAMATSPWVVPTMQAIHIVSIAVVFTSILVTALRVLGIAWTGVSLRGTVARFAPWAWTALAVLAVTGSILIMAEPVREIMAISFWLKMCLLAGLIVISVKFLRAVRAGEEYAAESGPVTPALRRNAILTIALLVAIIFLGRFIAYDPLIWGAWSPIHTV